MDEAGWEGGLHGAFLWTQLRAIDSQQLLMLEWHGKVGSSLLSPDLLILHEHA